jgi:PAS domain S-box-containing protein
VSWDGTLPDPNLAAETEVPWEAPGRLRELYLGIPFLDRGLLFASASRRIGSREGGRFRLPESRGHVRGSPRLSSGISPTTKQVLGDSAPSDMTKPPSTVRFGRPGDREMAKDPELQLAYLAAVVEASNDAIVSKALDGTITSWNASAERIFGYGSEEIIGKNIRTLIPADLQDEEDEILARIRAGDYIEHYETVRLRKDGRRLDVSLSISPIRNRAGEVIGASKIARDISARKLAEEQLLAATAKFESVFSQSGTFAAILDLDGSLREVNALAVESCGYAREEVLDRPFWSTPWWRGSCGVQDRIREAARLAAQGEVFRATLPYWTGDGSERLMEFAMHPIRDGSGAIRFLYPTGIDITERARAEAALRAREAEEHRIALGLQHALLPGKLVAPAGVSVAARYEAGSATLEVGGDWYDVLVLPNGSVALTVGDVVGHGLAAAAAMGQLRTALTAFAPYADRPGVVLARLDAFIAGTGVTDFATVCYGVLDPTTGVFEYASAGHPPILLLPPGGSPRWLSDALSPPLFGDERQLRPQAKLVLEPGSLLVLFTDGLIERRDESLTDGLNRLMAAGARLAGLPAAEVCDRLVALLGGESAEDDIAVLAVRFAPSAPGPFRLTFPARPEELRRLRASLQSWLDERGAPALTQEIVILATNEACANAIQHAYRDQPAGEVAVLVEEAERRLTITVRDFGRFLPPPGSATSRGRGTAIMQGVTVGFSRDSNPDGTTVCFQVPVVACRPRGPGCRS